MQSAKKAVSSSMQEQEANTVEGDANVGSSVRPSLLDRALPTSRTKGAASKKLVFSSPNNTSFSNLSTSNKKAHSSSNRSSSSRRRIDRRRSSRDGAPALSDLADNNGYDTPNHRHGHASSGGKQSHQKSSSSGHKRRSYGRQQCHGSSQKRAKCC